MTDAVLELRDLSVGYYRDLNILSDLHITARRGQITTILGANGVGKSTALKAAFGFLAPNKGDVVLNGRSIIDLPPYQKINVGLAYIPQQPGVFKDMTVEQDRGELRPLPRAARQAQAGHGRVVGWAAAHGGNRAHPDGRTENAAGG